MRKFLLILALVVSFSLGMAAQNLIAGNWVFPKYGTQAPTLRGNFNLGGIPGGVIYTLPTGWKVLDASPSSRGNLSVRFQKLE
ncbi:hypothetical protein [Desulfovibrio sp. JC022]|uniref:hypothetical protein n=1 Tax=Desulfovibrio sp. JC022 TaxID=2593642 RepID=UPI0013D4CD30|nr:hypothetical protein [Desulfovibrio sp. JC022]NDV22507.1 hypothetical protein [Desulfovibrio sp. JC022]